MSKALIYDSSFLVGLIDEGDKWHKTALEIHSAISASEFKIVYFDCVANEVISVLGKRCKDKKESEYFPDKLEKFRAIIPKEDITWIYLDIEDYYDEILGIMKGSSGKLNFHDSLICIAARKRNLRYIVSFNEDFDEVEDLIRIKEKKDLDKTLQAQDQVKD